MTTDHPRRSRHGARLIVSMVAWGALATACGGSTQEPAQGTTATTTAAASTATTTRTTIPWTTTPTTASSTIPSGFVKFTDAANRFTLSIPAGWRKIDPSNPKDLQAAQKALNVKIDQLEMLRTDFAGQGVKFYALDSTYSVVTLVVKPAVGPKADNLGEVAAAISAGFVKIRGVARGTEFVRLADRAAVRVATDIPLPIPWDGTNSLHIVVDYLTANGLAYSLTLSGNSPQLPLIADTLRVT